MRIAIVSTPFVPVPPRDYGGTELVLGELTAGLVRRGHDVTLYATGDSESEAEVRALYPEAVWPPNPLPDANHTSWALRDAVERGAEVIQLNSAVGLTFSRFVPRAPLVYTIHHDRDESASALYPYYPDVRYVAISGDQARRETDLPRVSVIHHGLNPSNYEPRTALEDYVFFIGRFARYKGVHTAIDVAERAGRPIRVAGLAHEDSVSYAEREVHPRLERSHVVYVGPVGMSAKARLLSGARALVAPITWNEPFGLVFIEAMLSGCPVVAYPRGSVPEVVDKGVTGFVVGDEAGMEAVLRRGGPLDDFDRERCRARAIERFGRERMVDDYERLFEAVVRERRRRGGADGRAA